MKECAVSWILRDTQILVGCGKGRSIVPMFTLSKRGTNFHTNPISDGHYQDDTLAIPCPYQTPRWFTMVRNYVFFKNRKIHSYLIIVLSYLGTILLGGISDPSLSASTIIPSPMSGTVRIKNGTGQQIQGPSRFRFLGGRFSEKKNTSFVVIYHPWNF